MTDISSQVASICDEEQLEIWSDEFVEHLLAAGCVPKLKSYGDKIVYSSAIKDAIKDLVGKALAQVIVRLTLEKKERSKRPQQEFDQLCERIRELIGEIERLKAVCEA
jgi:hypothetical protein